MAEVEAHRVERQPPAARLGQQVHGALGCLPGGLADQLAGGLGQRHAAAGQGRQVVGFTPAQRRQARAPEPARQAEQPGLFGQVQVEHADPVAEGVGRGSGAGG
jgi:hypothetical protein